MKMATITAITIHLRLIKTRMYSRSVDSCDGKALYKALVMFEAIEKYIVHTIE